MISTFVAAGTGVGGLAVGALLLGAYDPNSRIFGPVTGRGPRTARTVYLTFDDGPNPNATRPILETLAEHDVPATFFMVGEHVRRFPDVARLVVHAGHQIGNHTQHHVKLHNRGPGRIRRELTDAHAAILETTGVAPRIFRAPHGYRNPFVQPVVHRLGYQVFGWTFGVWDTALPGPEVIRARMRRKVRPGAILLLHDGDGYDPLGDRMQTAAALPGIIRDLRDDGYTFRPLADLLAA